MTTSFAHAEDLKNRHGCAFLVSHDDYENINVYPLGEEDDSSIRQMHRSDLIKIIAPRVEEIFEMVARKLAQIGRRNIMYVFMGLKHLSLRTKQEKDVCIKLIIGSM